MTLIIPHLLSKKINFFSIKPVTVEKAMVKPKNFQEFFSTVFLQQHTFSETLSGYCNHLETFQHIFPVLASP